MPRMHAIMSQRSTHPRNLASSSSAQAARSSDERRPVVNVAHAKPLTHNKVDSVQPSEAVTPLAHDGTHPSDGTALSGREARFRSDLEQVGQQLRGIQFGSLMITIQDGVVVQLDRTERTRLRKPHLPDVNQSHNHSDDVNVSPAIRREPRHPDC